MAYSLAGGLAFGVSYILDGATHNNPYDNLNLPLPFPDALQEFRAETSALTAQNGMHSGGAVNAVTKSGTQSVPRQRVRVLPPPQHERDRPVRGEGRRRQAQGRRAEAQPVRRARSAARSRPTGCSSSSAIRARTRASMPTDNRAFVPTAAMLAGDFTAFASPACNGGVQRTLRRAVCRQPHQPGAVQQGGAEHHGEAADDDRSVRPGPVPVCRLRATKWQYVSKVDYQLNDKHSALRPLHRHEAVHAAALQPAGGGAEPPRDAASAAATTWRRRSRSARTT